MAPPYKGVSLYSTGVARHIFEARARADAIMKQARTEADKIIANANTLSEETRKQANLNADKIENEPVASDIPVLILSGGYDPVTPP